MCTKYASFPVCRELSGVTGPELPPTSPDTFSGGDRTDTSPGASVLEWNLPLQDGFSGYDNISPEVAKLC